MLQTLLISTALVGTVLTSTPPVINAPAQPTPTVVLNFATSSEPEKPTIESLISDIAKEYKISSTTLFNLADSESELNPDPKGHNDGGRAAGIMQIHYKTWGFTKEQVLDPEFSLSFAAKHIAEGDAWKYWTPMNCYTFVNTKFNFTLPPMDVLYPNSPIKVGSVAIFMYSGGVKHVALVTNIKGGNFVVQEANYKPGVIGNRTIPLSDPHLIGFWTP